MGASVTIWEATAPVKLPTCHCLNTGSRCWLGLNLAKGGIPRLAPPRPEPRLRSLPPILCMVRPNPMAGYSKAPRGLSVQLRVTRVFTGRTTSPSLSSRQRSARYAIRAGRNFTLLPVARGRRLYLYLDPGVLLLTCPIDLGRHRRDFHETICRQVLSTTHLFRDVCEQLEVALL